MDISETLTALGISALIVCLMIVVAGLLVLFWVTSGLIVEYLHITGFWGLICRIAITVTGTGICVMRRQIPIRGGE